MTQSILVVAAHPDDEVLGCGATIAKHASQGDSVSILIVAEGLTSRQPHRDRDAASPYLSHLADSAHKAASVLGANSPKLLSYPDNRLDTVSLLDLVKEIEGEIEEVKPEIVYTHHSSDLNVDHRIVHQAVLTACRPSTSSPVARLLSFEVQSSTEWQPLSSGFPFQPNWYEDITSYLDIKMEALSHYSTEMRPWPHSRSLQSVEYLARLRGSQVGLSAAEAFCLLRNVA